MEDLMWLVNEPFLIGDKSHSVTPMLTARYNTCPLHAGLIKATNDSPITGWEVPALLSDRL